MMAWEGEMFCVFPSTLEHVSKAGSLMCLHAFKRNINQFLIHTLHRANATDTARYPKSMFNFGWICWQTSHDIVAVG